MKINLNEIAHNPDVQRLLRGMKCMEVVHGGEVVGNECTLDMDDHGKLTMAFDKPMRGYKAKRFDDVMEDE